MKEVIDGTTCTTLFTEADSMWSILQREGGSVCLYSNHPRMIAHLVVYDSLDGIAPNAWAMQQIARLTEMHEAIGALLASLNLTPPAPTRAKRL